MLVSDSKLTQASTGHVLCIYTESVTWCRWLWDYKAIHERKPQLTWMLMRSYQIENQDRDIPLTGNTTDIAIGSNMIKYERFIRKVKLICTCTYTFKNWKKIFFFIMYGGITSQFSFSILQKYIFPPFIRNKKC